MFIDDFANRKQLTPKQTRKQIFVFHENGMLKFEATKLGSEIAIWPH